MVAAGRRAAAQAQNPNVAAREAKMKMQGVLIEMCGFCQQGKEALRNYGGPDQILTAKTARRKHVIM